jgi:hypothetical protein
MACDTGEKADNDPGDQGRYNGRQNGFHGV